MGQLRLKAGDLQIQDNIGLKMTNIAQNGINTGLVSSVGDGTK